MNLSSVINVTANILSAAIAQAGFGMPMILGCSNHWSDLIREYSGTAGMVSDGFATTDPEYLAAAAIFAQPVHAPIIAVGRRTNLPTMQWDIVPVEQNNTVYKLWVGTQTGVFTAYTYTSSGSDSVNGIINGLVTALGSITGLTIANHGSGASLRLTATTAGAWFRVKADNPALLLVQQTHADAGIATDLQNIEAVTHGQDWYMVIPTTCSLAEAPAAAAQIQSQTMPALYMADTQDGNILTSSTSDTASVLKTGGYGRTITAYHEDNGEFFGSAWGGFALSATPGGSNWAYDTLVGVTAYPYNTTQLTNAVGNTGPGSGKNANLYTTLAGAGITWEGMLAAGSAKWIDIQWGIDWLVNLIQVNVANMLLAASNSGSKVPYTDGGIQRFEGCIRAAIDQGQKNGFIATNPAPVFSMPVAANVSSADRGNRVLNNAVVNCQLQGAINTANLTLNLTM